jgi:Na+/melibiose symporter-like transporter
MKRWLAGLLVAGLALPQAGAVAVAQLTEHYADFGRGLPMATSAKPETNALHTVAAIPLALVTFALCSTVASVAWFAVNYFLSDFRPVVLGFISSVMGALVGIYAARALCDRWLPRHNGKVVFGAFVVCGGAALVLEWTVLPNPAHPVIATASWFAVLWMGFAYFWSGERLR